MSDLYRTAISARLAKLPTDLPLMTLAPGAEEDEEVDEEQEGIDGLGALPSTRHPAASTYRGGRSTRKRDPNPDYAPISASTYFTQAAEVVVSPPESNAAAGQMNFRVYYTPPATTNGTVMVCHHGAGYSGLSFACFAKAVGELSKGEVGVLSLDARRHGKTTSASSDEDLSIGTLVSDLFSLLTTLFPDPSSSHPFLLVGHSMGGAVVARTCPMLLERKYRLAGIAVLEAVEGFALEALPHMHTLLNSRPDGFGSPEEAVEWHLKNHTIRNVTSSRISVPAIIVPSPSIPPSSTSSLSTGPAYIWRTPLRSTAPFWEGWFTGLSRFFLEARTARLLVLAGSERLDKELMIGQMQGKFQLVIVTDVGHMLHEDNPERLAEVLVDFWRRNERVIPGVKKVGDA